MTRAIKAVQTYRSATATSPQDKLAFDVLVRTEGEPDVTLQIMAHDTSDAIDRINSMPEAMLLEMVELERVVVMRVDQVVHQG